MRYCPLYGTDNKAVRCFFSTLKHRGAGSPYTRTLGIGDHALVVGHVTARKLEASPCGTYAMLVILLPCGPVVLVGLSMCILFLMLLP